MMESMEISQQEILIKPGFMQSFSRSRKISVMAGKKIAVSGGRGVGCVIFEGRRSYLLDMEADEDPEEELEANHQGNESLVSENEPQIMES